MQAQTLTPGAVFGNQVRYVVPLFQRPYVWTLDEQWQPLWEDVRAVAEQLLENPPGYGVPAVPPHFLGAIVLDQPWTPAGVITVRHIIDGQQRLTTLQLLLDAAQWVTEKHGNEKDTEALRLVVLNNAAITDQSDEVFKVWPTDSDQDAFRAAMDNDVQVPSTLAKSAIVQCHDYFVRTISEWADVEGSPEKCAGRLGALTMTLRAHLKVVVIDLEPGDNAQVIFETLNHRGKPLLAADLIKNLIFQVAQAQGLDVFSIYRKYWKRLDGDYWRQRIARGRQYLPRIDTFMNYWLVMRLHREVPGDRTFAEFRSHLVGQRPDLDELLAELAADAEIYASLDQLPESTTPGRFRYRVLEAMDTAVVTPVFLWLLRWPTEALPPAQRDKALDAIESWLVRRTLCRLSSKDINRIMLELLQALASAGPAYAGDITESVLLRQKADSRFWPSDETVRQALSTAQIYKTLLRARVRMVLEVLENLRRSSKSEDASCPHRLTVEHVMPQAWREHWGQDISDQNVKGALDRDAIVHTLGNLTLVTSKLNPALSNRPWSAAEAASRGLGGSGKRDALLAHSTLKLNADLIASNPDSWTEGAIRSRTSSLINELLDVWKRPPGPTQAFDLETADLEQPAGSAQRDTYGDGAPSGKYRLLTDWLRAQTAEWLKSSFADIEDILGQPLPPSARIYLPYWYSSAGPVRKAMTAGGYKPVGVNLTAERLTFERLEAYHPS